MILACLSAQTLKTSSDRNVFLQIGKQNGRRIIIVFDYFRLNRHSVAVNPQIRLIYNFARFSESIPNATSERRRDRFLSEIFNVVISFELFFRHIHKSQARRLPLPFPFALLDFSDMLSDAGDTKHICR
jgi:hypothetical protein